MTDVIHAPVQWGSNRYDALKERNLVAIAKQGVSLGKPDADLIAQGWDYGERTRRARSREYKMAPEQLDPYGKNIARDLALGEIAAELLGRRYGTGARWNDSGQDDGGVDLTLPKLGTIQVKAGTSFLSEKRELHDGVDYYAMVYYAGAGDTVEDEYVFCGLISLVHFRERRFTLEVTRGEGWRRGRLVKAVTAADLTLTPAEALP